MSWRKQTVQMYSIWHIPYLPRVIVVERAYRIKLKLDYNKLKEIVNTAMFSLRHAMLLGVNFDSEKCTFGWLCPSICKYTRYN